MLFRTPFGMVFIDVKPTWIPGIWDKRGFISVLNNLNKLIKFRTATNKKHNTVKLQLGRNATCRTEIELFLEMIVVLKHVLREDLKFFGREPLI